MASRISELLAIISNGVRGIDVRNAIHDAIAECYEDVHSAKTTADESVGSMSSIISSANNAATAATNAATAANNAAAAANNAAEAWANTTENAESFIDAMSDYADRIEAAEDSIEDAVENCETATTAATAAARAWENAASSASTAAGAANTAANSAASAATRADNAAADARSAASAAVAAASMLVDSELSNTSEKAVQNKVIKAALDTKYVKPQGGIPATDLAAAVQASLDLADSALQSHQDVSGKADKVPNPTNGNFAALDANGNLIDSGHKHSDYLTEHQSLAGYLRTSSLEAKTSAMTQSVGVDSNGKLWTTPGSGSGSSSGATDYSDLQGKPTIGGVEVSGNKTLADYGIAAASAIPALPVAFTVTLAANSWSNHQQTVSNAYFLASGCAYIITPSGNSIGSYSSCKVYADEVTTDGSATFHCTTVPSSALTVNVIKVVVA